MEKYTPSRKRFCADPTIEREASEEEEEEEEEEVQFITAHLDPDAVIWSADTDSIPLSSGKFHVGWTLDGHQAAEEEHPKETMFLIENRVENKNIDLQSLQKDFKKATDLVKKASNILLIAGAGMGCDSNLPDYRSANGFWKQYPPLVKAGVTMKQMSQSDWFRTDPSLAWGFYSHRQHLYETAEPHDGFKALHELLTDNKKKDYFIMTSNVDSQFQKSKFSEDKIFETHGTLSYQQCVSNCKNSEVWKDKNVEQGKPLEIDMTTFRVIQKDKLPRCSSCNGLARPNVSFFTDTNLSFNDTRQLQQKEKIMDWLNTIKTSKNDFLTIIEIGCGTSIHSLRYETEILLYHTPSLDNRVGLIRINPVTYEVEHNNINQVGIPLGAKEGLLNIIPNKK